MKLLIPETIVKRFKRHLRGRFREVGGVLVGEHVADDRFRLIDLSFQKSGGTLAHFVRDPKHHKAFLENFFAKTGTDYRRFNYLGEWHSHPLFTPTPSGEDVRTMARLVIDPDVGANFAVLIIVRLRIWSRLEMTATLFRPATGPEKVSIEIEPAEDLTPKKRVRYRFI